VTRGKAGLELSFAKMHGAGNDFVVFDAIRDAAALPSDLAALSRRVADRNFGIGADPDCHFYNCGVSLDMSYRTPVPEPGTLLLVGGALSVVGIVRRRRRKSAAK